MAIWFGFVTLALLAVSYLADHDVIILTEDSRMRSDKIEALSSSFMHLATAPSKKVLIPPTAAEIYAKIMEKTQVFQFLEGLNPNFVYARVHLLDRTPFSALEEAHAYCLSDQIRRSLMPSLSRIPSETSVMVIRYAYPAPPSVYTRRHPGRQPPKLGCQASSIASGLPPAIDLPLSGIEPSPTPSIPVTTDEDSPVSYIVVDLPSAATVDLPLALKVPHAVDLPLAHEVDLPPALDLPLPVPPNLPSSYELDLPLVLIGSSFEVQSPCSLLVFFDSKLYLVWKEAFLLEVEAL
ncbi:hypothetical protein GIB67_039772 [Kingdonia uniflora]|uniref:Uncharacterized protein n=1 Tax=Kingdonia uniflora TaxID=39325 RepID=A0A7J7MQ51_9MAGN|nr:hypothetical protein GIB67_039772 [Kingdonia uniflora]